VDVNTVVDMVGQFGILVREATDNNIKQNCMVMNARKTHMNVVIPCMPTNLKNKDMPWNDALN